MDFMARDLKRVLLVMVMCMSMFFITFPSSAEVKQAPLLTLEASQDLVVMFRYDRELIDIAFISPSGKTFDQKSGNLESVSGDLWRTYRIREAEAGQWMVAYDLGSNTQIEYSLVDGNNGLWIQEFMITKLSAEHAEVSFTATFENAAVNYVYKVYAVPVGGDQSNRHLLLSDRALSNEAINNVAGLSALSSGSYRLVLEVQMDDAIYGKFAFDTGTTSEFKYVNPNTPAKPDDYSVHINQDALSIIVDWSGSAKQYNDAYRVTVYADTRNVEPFYQGVMDVQVDQTRIYYPEDAQKLMIVVNYERNQIESEALIKEVDLAGSSYLSLDEKAITCSSQVRLNYGHSEETTLRVSINGSAQSEFQVQGEGFIGLGLASGHNHIYAEFEGADHIFHIVDTEIYLDIYPPEIILYDRLDGTVVSRDTIQILGEVKYGNALKINDTPVVLSDSGGFSHTYVLEPGENIITLSATDQNGNTSLQVITVFKKGLVSRIQMNYLPMAASFAVGVLIMILSLVFIKKASASSEPRPKSKGKQYAFRVLQGVILLTLCFSVYKYMQLSRLMVSVEFIDLVEVSLEEAMKQIESKRLYGLVSIGSAVCLVLSIIVVRMIKKHF